MKFDKDKKFYSLINQQRIKVLLGIRDEDQLSEYHRNWVEEILQNGLNHRDAKWTESIAVCPVKSIHFIYLTGVGNKEFVTETKAKLGVRAIGRREMENNEGY